METVNFAKHPYQEFGIKTKTYFNVFILFIIINGFSGIVSQIIILRETLTIFSGNELTIGIILAGWLFFEALGSISARKTDSIKNKYLPYIYISLFLTLLLPVTIILIRSIHSFLNIIHGQEISIIYLFNISFFIVLPISFMHGFLFTLTCGLYHHQFKETYRGIGKVYIYETLGTAIGGFLFSLVLIQIFTSIQTSIIIIIQVILSSILFLKSQSKPPQKTCIFLIFFLVLILVLLFSGTVNRIENWSLRIRWRNQNVVMSKNSIYGNITTIKNQNQYTIYSDGVPLFTIPEYNTEEIEEFVHLPLLFVEKPQEILVLSGGAGGIINEILKHDIKKLDYVELDPVIINSVLKIYKKLNLKEQNNKFSSKHLFEGNELTNIHLTNENEFVNIYFSNGNERTNIHLTDGVAYVNNTNNIYDAVFLGISSIPNFQTNRFFTEDFFLEIKQRLSETGIFVLSLPGSISYLSEEHRNLNRIIYNTLNSVFNEVIYIPGNQIIYIGTKNETINDVNQSILKNRFKKRNLDTKIMTEFFINYKINELRMKWFKDSIMESELECVNTNFTPIGLFHYLSYTNAMFSPHVNQFLSYITNINKTYFFLTILLLIIIFYYALNKFNIRNFKKTSLLLCIFTTGFSSMIFDLILIISFQIIYGYLFYRIGLLITAFMIGSALGGWFIICKLDKIKKGYMLFLLLEILFLIFGGLLYLVIIRYNKILYHSLPNTFEYIIIFMAFITGCLGGGQFPVASKIFLSGNKVTKTAGILYANDLLGGVLSGLLCSIILIPVFGIVSTLLLSIAIKSLSLTLYSIFWLR